MSGLCQLDLFAPPPMPAPAYRPRDRREVLTRSATHGGMVTVYDGDPDPFEILVRGIPTVITYSGGFCTHAIEPAGSAYWSETGFRSFGAPTSDPDEIAAIICAYIDAPAKQYGMGGELTRWWPGYVLQWQQSRGFALTFTRERGGREHVWDQWGPERHAEIWAKHDLADAQAIERMRADGIDPNDVGPPKHFKGKWPRVGA